jgi:hypothetical protein
MNSTLRDEAVLAAIKNAVKPADLIRQYELHLARLRNEAAAREREILVR